MSLMEKLKSKAKGMIMWQLSGTGLTLPHGYETSNKDFVGAEGKISLQNIHARISMSNPKGAFKCILAACK